jgi:hypothetical protein
MMDDLVIEEEEEEEEFAKHYVFINSLTLFNKNITFFIMIVKPISFVYSSYFMFKCQEE